MTPLLGYELTPLWGMRGSHKDQYVPFLPHTHTHTSRICGVWPEDPFPSKGPLSGATATGRVILGCLDNFPSHGAIDFNVDGFPCGMSVDLRLSLMRQPHGLLWYPKSGSPGVFFIELVPLFSVLKWKSKGTPPFMGPNLCKQLFFFADLLFSKQRFLKERTMTNLHLFIVLAFDTPLPHVLSEGLARRGGYLWENGIGATKTDQRLIISFTLLRTPSFGRMVTQPEDLVCLLLQLLAFVPDTSGDTKPTSRGISR